MQSGGVASILRGLAGPPRALAEVAELIEQYIGDGSNRQRCAEVLDALRRVRRGHPSYYLRVSLRPLDGAGEPCDVLRAVVATMRKWRHFSGA